MEKNLLVKQPFKRVTANSIVVESYTYDNMPTAPIKANMQFLVMSQGDFVREYEPTGHKINSPLYYPNIIKYDEEKKQYFEQKVFRAAFPFQQIISTQHLVHLCGNDIHHEIAQTSIDDNEKELLVDFQKGWLDKNIEIAFYEFAKSVMITGDGAIVMYLKNGQVGSKVLTFLNDDTLYPHYDEEGNLEMFARQYASFDTQGNKVVSYVELWDKTHYHRYRQENQGVVNKIKNKLASFLGMNNYVEEECKPHGFDEVPVVYLCNPQGPCWSAVQDAIDKYELAVSHLCQNNCAYAFPIMVLKGESVEVQGDIYGGVKAITMDSDADAEYLERQNGTDSFKLQLDILLKQIFLGSFTVLPPEIKSGDMSGIAVKLTYSPSLEKAMIDAREFDRSVDKLSRLFKFGYGVETGKASRYTKLKILSYIVPYIHSDTAELVNNLVQLIASGALSKQTASELSGFGRNNEYALIKREEKEHDSADLLTDIRPTPQN